MPKSRMETLGKNMGKNMHYELDNPELGLEDREMEGWQDVETDESDDDDYAGRDCEDTEDEDSMDI